jgi:hypothetical protein
VASSELPGFVSLRHLNSLVRIGHGPRGLPGAFLL